VACLDYKRQTGVALLGGISLLIY